MFWTFLGVALVGYLAGMLGSVFYSLLLYSRLPNNPGGSNILLLIFAYEMVKLLQLPKLAVALGASALALWLAPSVGAAVTYCALTCFFCSGLVFAWLAYRSK